MDSNISKFELHQVGETTFSIEETQRNDGAAAGIQNVASNFRVFTDEFMVSQSPNSAIKQQSKCTFIPANQVKNYRKRQGIGAEEQGFTN